MKFTQEEYNTLGTAFVNWEENIDHSTYTAKRKREMRLGISSAVKTLNSGKTERKDFDFFAIEAIAECLILLNEFSLNPPDDFDKEEISQTYPEIRKSIISIDKKLSLNISEYLL